MGCIPQYDNYHITSEPGRLLPDEQVKYHNHHYKNGASKFETWLRAAVKYTKEELSMNYFPRLAETYAREHDTVPDEPLYNLQKWLRGRLVCYCHHLLKGNAEDGHIRPITVALELIQILRPEESDNIINECAPMNFWALLQIYGSEKAK